MEDSIDKEISVYHFVSKSRNIQIVNTIYFVLNISHNGTVNIIVKNIL